jgi:hypothetical protein
MYSDQENMEFIEISQASMVDYLPKNFDLKNPLREAKKYMENEKILTAITDDSTGEEREEQTRKEPPTRKSPCHLDSPGNTSNKRPRTDMNGDPDPNDDNNGVVNNNNYNFQDDDAKEEDEVEEDDDGEDEVEEEENDEVEEEEEEIDRFVSEIQDVEKALKSTSFVHTK